jgi:trehalose synthase
VIWRCHVGLDHPNALARGAWDFLRPYVLDADAYVFSRPTFAWDGLDRRKVSVIHPSIDAFSAKNQDQTPEQAQAILTRAGIVAGRCDGATFVRDDGTPGRVDRQATVLQAATLAPDDRTVVQISRWDALKDPVGVIAGFAERVAGRSDAHLVLAGPSTDAVADDPEGAKVLQQAVKAWERLPRSTQRRVHLASLPMADADENAAIVNALQRHADVVVQKSVAEGFGLTVAEAMWKARPVVASAIGGIQDQIVDGESGVLLADPLDLTTFGDEVSALLRDPERANQIGTAARQRVRQRFLGPHHLGRFFDLIETVTARPESVANCVR